MNWMVDIVGWIESLKVAVINYCNKSRSTHRFFITSKTGRKLLNDGFESLLGMSEDIKRCTYRSIGIYMLRWILRKVGILGYNYHKIFILTMWR